MALGKKYGGRTKGTPNKNRQAFLDVLTKGKQSRFSEIVAKQYELAKGIFVEKEIHTPKGPVVTKVYLKEPDQKAGQFLIEQVIGKATQAIEVTDSDKKFSGKPYLE